MRRCVIVGGAEIRDYPSVRKQLREDDFFIFCDSGLNHMEALGVVPGLIVGDFDSHEPPCLDTETIVLPCEKDDTDTFFAVREAIRRGYEEFLLIGVIGGRLDHTLGNVSILLFLDSQGKRGAILDDHSLMEIISGEPAFIPADFPCFSLISIGGPALGVTIENAKYPLTDAGIFCEYQYGVSNEVLPGQIACVSLREGRLLLIKNF